MTTKPKVTAEDTTAEPTTTEEAKGETPKCGTPHHLALLAHLACQKDAGHGIEEGAGEADRQHRAVQDGTVYVWE
ncbi:hypothetical protein ACFY0F_23525 [Streptomyces sp. NPDC001544]|uniref:hypothetical protein n=1 Tax=Streptomyces sp. NPDC001544 TaxID=3364584 RepID=UPI003697A207